MFTLDEMVEAFDIKDVNPNPARFDLKKAEAINAAHMRMLSVEDITDRVLPFLKAAGVARRPASHDADAQLLELAMPLVAERINKLTEAVDMLGFLFVDEATSPSTRSTPRSCSTTPGATSSGRRTTRSTACPTWSTAAIEEALQRRRWSRGSALKPAVAFGPVRVAVTGRRISPPLFESLELLGRERSLARLARAAG